MGTKVDPGRYAWLRHSPLEVAGCVTVVAAPDEDRVKAAFGCGEEVPPPEDGERAFLEEDAAHIAVVPGGLVVSEDKGYQGSREEVLKPASKASETGKAGKAGKAASIFWNVNDVIRFTCSRRGKVLCTFELGDAALDLEEDGEFPEGLPVALRPLLQMAASEGADLVAIGAAMVEAFTGVGFGPDALTSGRTVLLTPPQAELETDSAEYSALSYSDDRLHQIIVTLEPATQRALAELVTEAAVAAAGVADEPEIMASIGQFGGADVGRPSRGLAPLTADWTRTLSALEDRDMRDEASDRLDSRYAAQKHWAGDAVRYAFHPDPLTAATRCVRAALLVFSCSRTERVAQFVEDASGRYDVYPEGPYGREPEFRAVFDRLLDAAQADWPAIRADLPNPLTAAERAEALRLDAEREERGDFATWQMG